MFFNLDIHFINKLIEQLWEQLWHWAVQSCSWVNLKGNLYLNFIKTRFAPLTSFWFIDIIFLIWTSQKNLSLNLKSSLMLTFLKTQSTFQMLKLFLTMEPLKQPSTLNLHTQFKLRFLLSILEWRIQHIPKGLFFRI